MLSRGALVRDLHTDRSKILDDYCPKTEHCEEGTHVMCMYYNPKTIMGPQCHKSKDIHISPDDAMQFVDLANVVRGHIAKGEEIGKDGVKLPRAYGMFKVEWDEELATFAQVLANQCILRHDMCRASKRFPEPGQTAGIVRFTFPDWYSLYDAENSTAGLTNDKLVYGVQHIFQTWYALKEYVSPDMIRKYPDWAVDTDKAAGRLYLEMINGKSTRIGCGLSAYAAYAYHANNADLTYNNIQIICNYSTRSRPGEEVYNMKPPTSNDIGYTLRCGCPVGYDEDPNCLCYPSNRGNPELCENDQCKPSVVLLPIFTVEDAPEDKMIHSNKMVANNTIRLTDSFEIFDHFDKFTKKPFLHSTQHHNIIYHEDPTRKNQRKRVEHKHTSVGRRYFNGQLKSAPYRDTPAKIISSPSHKKKHRSGQSIFSRTAIFELPNRKLITKTTKTPQLIRKDVVPRKDFTNVRKLVTTYLNRRRANGKDLLSKSLNKEIKHLFNDSSLEEHEKATESILKTTISIINFNQYKKDKTYDYSNVSINSAFKVNHDNGEDKNVLNLINDLKTEVKHIHFDKKEKEIFDAKLRQLYDTLAINAEDKLNTDLNSRNSSIKNGKYRTFNDIKTDHLKDNIKKNPNDHFDRLFHKKFMHEYSTDNIGNENDLKHMKDGKPNENKLSKIYGIRRRNKDFYRRTGNGDVRNNYYLRKDNFDEGLSTDRRRYYQEKLDNLERKLKNLRDYKRKNIVDT
ncbi:uncharacterized protein LOC123702822 isoform X2 [Colias croceus]|uniref:uncharacterized protein LOC123702822 isoform X2 n=1 Tax=Colias crocea TaxID=72248 RepID=UPI001E27E27F|nr:uncharacterized protein LOC123702822 isoform X2 [Colias croceus]